jgi:hypothetical protein
MAIVVVGADLELIRQDAEYELLIAGKELEDAKQHGNEYEQGRLVELIKMYEAMREGKIDEAQERYWARNRARVSGKTERFVAATVSSRQEVDDARLTIYRDPANDTWYVQEWDDELIQWTLSRDGMWDDRVRHAIVEEYGTLRPERDEY